MAISRQLKRYAGGKLARRMTRSIPWFGAVIALATLGSAIRRKGVLGGTLHTALDMIPYVGGVKNIAEAGRGRDFIRDKPRPQPPALIGPNSRLAGDAVQSHLVRPTAADQKW